MYHNRVHVVHHHKVDKGTMVVRVRNPLVVAETVQGGVHFIGRGHWVGARTST